MNKIRLFSLFIALLVLLGSGLWLFTHSRDKASHPSVASATALRPDAKPSSAAPLPAPDKTTTSPHAVAPALPEQTDTPAGPSIGDLLANSSLDNKAVMAGLAKITLDSKRTLGERTEAISHLLNLSVEDPSPVLLPLITDARLPDTLCQQILDDSLNDPPSWQADAHLAALAHRDGKEIQTKARDHLTFLVGTDYGDNLTEWTKAIILAKAKWDQSSK